MGFISKILSIQKKSDVVLALDIGTEVIKALVFQVDSANNKGIVIGVGKIRQELGNMQSGAVSDIAGVVKIAREAIDIAKEKAGVKNVKYAIVGIAGELVKGTTTTVHYERANADLKIGLPELSNIIQKVQQKAYERIGEQIAWETGQSNIDIKLINAAVSDVRIDGYRINNPLGFQGHNVSISVFNAYAPTIHLGAIESIVNELGIDLVSIAAEPYAVAKLVDFEGDLNFNSIFIDIGGGTTDIAVVRNGGLEGTKMFALGGRAFTKRLAQEVRVDFERAEKLKINYSLGKLSKMDTEKVERIFEDDCRIWLNGIELALAEFSQSDLLPNKILMCGGGSGLPGIKKALLSKEWLSKLAFVNPPKISFLRPQDAANIIDKTGELTSTQDVTPMGLAGLVLELSQEEKVLAGILKRAMNKVDYK
ncbi:MAG: cell division protein (septum formation) [Candidatus Moranbacteria bacterium GW2011_GWE1_35_17]|nr:MAG: cell division protein (septum formation) [Candidatus Moranbacteria bacterium GW2011_GWE1_35_17]KKP69404.1 MAG: cell division protein (septum formation) [Candidatus Moranbacteria bacterium GW2011_GWE2_35_164]KKP81894.1 MAG: cell division protein (septum formation) [Candidatus Moranbacteria bacterium GW2011_GWF1_35_5]KKP85137.1 MAG: cell division protein (septum formation) [Candidatus Moranbacteria bacterium GW2011_GWF2_35_54]